MTTQYNDTQDINTQHKKSNAIVSKMTRNIMVLDSVSSYAECRKYLLYAQCRYTVRHYAINMLSLIMLSLIMLSLIMLSLIMLSVIMLSVVMLIIYPKTPKHTLRYLIIP